MRTMRMFCMACHGRGMVQVFKQTGTIDESGQTSSIQSVLLSYDWIECGECKGHGYIEVPVFTPEEAQAILKHCNLPTEGDEVSEQ